MKLKYRLSIIVSTIIVIVVGTISVFLLTHATSMQIEEARESQERLAAEQARSIQKHYEVYLQIINTLAGIMSDFDVVEVGTQRNRLNQIMESTFLCAEEIVGVFVVFKPSTIDLGMDEAFIGETGNTETGQWASWYTKRSGQTEHLVYDNVPEMMSILNGSKAYNSTIDEPVPQNVAGKDTHLLKMTVPVIIRKTNEVVGRVGVNIDISYIQPVVDEVIEDPDMDEVSAITIYTDNSTIVASGMPNQTGKLLVDAQSQLYGDNTNIAVEAVLKGEKKIFSEYSPTIDKNLEIILYPFTIGDTGVRWSLMLGSDRDIILKEVHTMTYFTIVIAVISIIGAGLIVFFVVSHITKPITDINTSFSCLGAGDLTKSININSKDEIGDCLISASYIYLLC